MSLKSPARASKPSFELENNIDGPVCGLDEVGRGPLAGPVTAACVYIPKHAYALPFIPEIRDSKKLSKPKLEYLYDAITTHFDWAVAEKTPQEIDEMNILQASLSAMADAMLQIHAKPVHALVDGIHIPKTLPCRASAVKKGDNISVSIAAASIVAKVTRDRFMEKLHQEHPHYGWNTNVGYPSQAHLDGIDAHGITKFHRKSFGPVKNFLEFGQTRKAALPAA